MTEPLLDAKAICSETDLLAAAIYIDRYVLDAVNRLDEDFSGIHSLATNTFGQINKNKHALNEKVMIDKETPRNGVTANLEQITSHNEKQESKASTPKQRLQALCECCDCSLVFYQEVAEINDSDPVKVTASELASTALDRFAVLRQAYGDVCGCES